MMRYIEFFKNNYKKLIKYFALAALIVIYHPVSDSEFWNFLLGINARIPVLVLDTIVNSIVLAVIFFFESKIKLREKFAWLTRNISEYRIGFVCFATLLASLAVLAIIMLFMSRYINNEIVSAYILSYVLFIFPFYVLYIMKE